MPAAAVLAFLNRSDIWIVIETSIFYYYITGQEMNWLLRSFCNFSELEKMWLFHQLDLLAEAAVISWEVLTIFFSELKSFDQRRTPITSNFYFIKCQHSN